MGSGKGRGLSDFGVEEIRSQLQDRTPFRRIYVRNGDLEENPILILSDVYILILLFRFYRFNHKLSTVPLVKLGVPRKVKYFLGALTKINYFIKKLHLQLQLQFQLQLHF